MARKKREPEAIVIEPKATVSASRSVQLDLPREPFQGYEMGMELYYLQVATTKDVSDFLAAVYERGGSGDKVNIYPQGLTWTKTDAVPPST